MDRTVALLRLRFCLDGPARSDHWQPFQLIDRLRELEVFGRPELEARGEGFGIDLRSRLGVDLGRGPRGGLRRRAFCLRTPYVVGGRAAGGRDFEVMLEIGFAKATGRI